MNVFLNASEYKRLYRCDYLAEREWKQYGEQQPSVGFLCVLLGVIYWTTYIPCLVVLYQKDFFKKSCFKIIFLIGCLDIIAILVNCFITGFLLLVGSVFCLDPALHYISSMTAISVWCGQCLACAILAINRLVDFWYSKLSVTLFKGKRMFFWFIPVLFYMLFIAMFSRIGGLSSKKLTWQYDPYSTVPQEIVPVDRSVYRNHFHEMNNCFLIPFITVIYLILIISICAKTRRLVLRVQLQLIVQAGLICLLLLLPGFLFLAVEFLPMPEFVEFISLIAWQLGNGGGGLILLLCNKRIRNAVIRLVLRPDKPIYKITTTAKYNNFFLNM